MDSDVIPKYLEHLCRTKYKGSLEAYAEDFDDEFLKKIEKNVQVYLTDRGLMDMADDFSAEEFKRIQEQVILKFRDTNKEKFQVDEGVTLELELKNVPELTIKVFEFNTETYYKRNLKPFDSSINLHGMVPTYERVEKDSLKDIPKNKIIHKKFEFPELQGKVGLFIIEFQGNGKQGRAVIKKGQLSLIHRSTSAGHIAYVVDAKKQICKTERTGVWLDNKFYACNPEKNGQIFIPYGTSQQKLSIIMINGDFAQLGYFVRKTESYRFEVFTHLLSESVLVGQEAKVAIRPLLTINGRKASVKMLKNVKATVTTRNYIKGSSSQKVFSNLKLHDDLETLLAFQVPPNLEHISVQVECQIQNVTTKNLQTLSSQVKSFHIKHHGHQVNISELYLRRENNHYYLYSLGRNGEPNQGKYVEVAVSLENDEDYQCQLKTDKLGRVDLAELTNAVCLRAKLVGESGHYESWMLDQDRHDKWTQPSDIHIIEGEDIELPINFPKGETLKCHQAGLKMMRDNKLIKNLFSRIQITEKPNYQVLSLKGLESGNYDLKLNLPGQHFQVFNIFVHKGEYWEGNFILKRNKMMESSSQKNAIRLEETTYTKNGQGVKMQIGISNASPLSRVHVFATQFIPNCSDSFRALLENASSEHIKVTNFPFAIWKNIFESEHEIGDEIRYVLDRKNKPALMGNTLQRPSLLMKKMMVRTTTSVQEQLNEGTVYASKDLSGDQNPDRDMLGRQVGKKGLFTHDTDANFIKDYQNFLSCSPLQVFNLKPDEFGNLSVQLDDLANYSQVFIVACDKDSAVQRQIPTQQILAQTGAELQDYPIPKRDLTISRDANDSEESGLMDFRSSDCLKTGDRIHIEDVTSSEIQIVDTLEKMMKVVEIMESIGANPDFRNGDDFQLYSTMQNIFMKWPKYSDEKKQSQFSQKTCHEINFFLFHRDRKFFDTTVLPFIQNKLEKTFMDLWLINSSHDISDQIMAYLDNPRLLKKLNAIEHCLLVQTCLKHGNEKQKAQARAFGLTLIEKFTWNQKQNPYFSDGNLRSKIIDAILSISDMDQAPRLEEIYSQQALALSYPNELQFGYAGDDMLNLQGGGGLFASSQINYQAPQPSYGYAPPPQPPQGGPPPPPGGPPPHSNFLFGSANTATFSYEICNMDQQMMNAMPMAQNAMPMAQNVMPMAQQQMQQMQQMYPYPTSQAAPHQPQVQNRMISKVNHLFDAIPEVSEQRNKRINHAGFKDIEKTAEYTETHYFNTIDQSSRPEFYGVCKFVVEYMQHVLKETDQPFLTDSFMDMSKRYVPFALALISLPLEEERDEEVSHKYESDKKRGIFLQASSNAVVFKKEIKLGKCELSNEVMISHRYVQYHSKKEVKDFAQNCAYQCEVIMTNISPESRQVTLLFQTPNGSLPLIMTKYIDSKQFTLSPYTTLKQTMEFYFPKNGKFDHPPSNVSADGIVIGKSKVHMLEVGKKQIISKVETFQDLMLTTSSQEAKKQKILDLLKTREGLLHDLKYGFKMEYILHLTFSDSTFLLQVLEILNSKMCHFDYPELISQVVDKGKAYLTGDQFLKSRSFILSLIRHHIESCSLLRGYLFTPIRSILLNKTEDEILDVDHSHLEYYPIVNQRVYAIGGQTESQENGYKKILNVEFAGTYKRFLFLALHFKDMPQKFKLQMAYFLQLQDRIDEAIKIFTSIDCNELTKGGKCQIAYDYLKAYFEFVSSKEANLDLVREIVEKYKDCSIPSTKKAFAMIRQQLDEIDQTVTIEVDEEVDADQEEEVTEEQKKDILEKSKLKNPTIYSAKMVKGSLLVEVHKIPKLFVKYYPIDAEILFSRSPFVQKETYQFSYVKPFAKDEVQVADGETEVKINLPENLRGKNLVIEVNSDDCQKIITHYSSNLKVQFNQVYGQLRVFSKITGKPMPMVYVKVFCKTKQNEEMFFRDGFTDIRGKFDYATVSGKPSNTLKKFAVLVSSEKEGQLIKEVDPPKPESS